MLEFGSCPRCKLDISQERRIAAPVICNHCGYIPSNNERMVQTEIESQSSMWMTTVCVVVVASYLQLMTWDIHSVNVLPLMVKETIGMSTPEDHEAKAQICMDLKKWDCVETEYTKTAGHDQGKLLRLAQFQMKRAKFHDAAKTYYAFFQQGGNNLEASYAYATALAKLGQVDDAITYFNQVIAARPDVIQVTVVHNYVKLLMEHQRFNQAKVLIENIRKSGGPSAGSFMEPEFEQIRQASTASRD